MNKYINLVKASTPYAKKMTRLRNRIFGDVVRPTDMSSMKVVKMFSEKPFYTRDEVVNYYPRIKEMSNLTRTLRQYGLFRDEHEDFREEMERRRILRGKVKPKKGMGKQALNR